MMSNILTWIGYFFLAAFALYGLFFLYIIYYTTPQSRGAKAIDKAKSKQYYYQDNKIVHAMNANFFSLGATVIEEADMDTFTVLAYNFAKDKNHVYYNDIIIEDADPESFELIPFRSVVYEKQRSYLLTKDKNHLYYVNKKFEQADTNSFQGLWGEYAQDAKHIFFNNEVLLKTEFTPKKIANDKHENYLQLKDRLFFQEREIKGVDLESFELIEAEFSRDKHHVYYGNHVIENADGDSFKVHNEHYQSDKNGLYYDAMFINGSDSASYKYIDQLYSKDKNQVYYLGLIIKDENPNKFNKSRRDKLENHQMHFIFHYDANHVLYAVRKNIEEISDSFSLYEGEIYSQNSRIIDADIDTFEVMKRGDALYSKDKNHIYHMSKIIKDVDKDSFEIINDRFSKDYRHVYYFEKAIDDLASQSFVYKEGMYAEEQDGKLLLRYTDSENPF
jgi:hypothetical protein